MMRIVLRLLPCLLMVSVFGVSVYAAGTPDQDNSQFRIYEAPRPPANPAEIRQMTGPMYASVPADTFVFGWWQFDDVSGEPDEQGWTAVDRTLPVDTFFHVDGTGCCPVTPINGNQSMYCGSCAPIPYWCSDCGPHGFCRPENFPGYGNNWDAVLESETFACTTLTFSYTAEWSTEPGYDEIVVQYWDDAQSLWVSLPVNGAQGLYDGSGGPLFESFVVNPPNYTTKLRFYFVSDGAFSDEDGFRPSNEGAFKIDDITVSCSDIGGEFVFFEDWEDESCNARQSDDGVWSIPPREGYGLYANLLYASGVVQEDPCRHLTSNVWEFFDDPGITNYACGGWPAQGAVPYGPDNIGSYGQYMHNELRSPMIPITGSGNEYIVTYTVYRDLPLDNLVFYYHNVFDWYNGCASWWWNDEHFWVRYSDKKDWFHDSYRFSLSNEPSHIQIAIGAFDMCWNWCGIYGSGECHSHAPLIDQIKFVRVDTRGPHFEVKHAHLFQDNFSQDGSITGPARADMAWDTQQGGWANIPGDSIAIRVTEPDGLAEDGTIGGAAVYCYVRVADRWGDPVPGKTGAAIQSPDVRPGWAALPGSIRFPWVGDITCDGVTWSQFRMDSVYAGPGGPYNDEYCFDLMDIANGRHVYEDQTGNTGVFTPGDVIWYFFGAQSSAGEWMYWHRTVNGQGDGRMTTAISEACASPCEFSILPDAGRSTENDILFVDHADDRGGPVQVYFDFAFWEHWMIVDRYDVLDPSTSANNSLASRVVDVSTQIIGPYQKIIWATGDLSEGLIGAGIEDIEKSDDFALLYEFLGNDSLNPGVYFTGDDIAEEWVTLASASAVNFRSTFMNFDLLSGDHRAWGEQMSPTVYSGFPGSIPVFDPPTSLAGPDTMVVQGGCPGMFDFDVLAPTGASTLEMAYQLSQDAAVLAQETTNSVGTTARVVLSGFSYSNIRDDRVQFPTDRLHHLSDIIAWFGNFVLEPVGVDPIAFENRLEDAYPNPFNPTTTIRYGIAERGHVSLKIYNVAGQLVRTLVDEMQTPLESGFSEEWNGSNNTGQPVSSGVYFYRLATKGYSQTKKMVLLK